MAPISFDAATLEVWGPLLQGGCCVLFPEGPFNMALLGEVVRAHAVNTLWLTAALFHAVVDEAPDLLEPIRYLLAGGDVLSADHVARIRALLPGTALINGYGPTESTTFACCYPVPAGWTPAAGRVPIGPPIANTRTYVLDEGLQPLPPGLVGELYLAGDGLARGYHQRGDLTAERFMPHPFPSEPGARVFKTGDLAYWLPGGVIGFIGRRDNQVKLRGFRIELGEIEAVLLQHSAVEQAAVVVRTVAGGKQLVAYVRTALEEDAAKDRLGILAGELHAFLEARLPDYMLPAAVVPLSDLPLTPTQKIDRRALAARDPYALLTGEDDYTAPRTEAEEILARVWSGLLGQERIGIHDNFFERGGDSIIAIQVISRARQAGLSLTPQLLFEFPTIAELATRAAGTDAVDAEQGPVSGELPLTPIQATFFGWDLPVPRHFNMPLMLRVPASLDADRLQAALDLLLRHHDALRLRFSHGHDGWHQTHAPVEETVPLLVADIEGATDEARLAALESAASEVQASLDLSAGPLLRAALFRFPRAEDGQRLLLAVHHLVVDGVSWRVLLEDLQTALADLERGETPRLPAKTSSYKRWAQVSAEYGASAQAAAEVPFWTRLADAEVRNLPRDGAAGDSGGHVDQELDAEHTRALLQEVPQAYRVGMNDVLLAALAMTAGRINGGAAVLVDLEGHGREDLFANLDLSRTVGWFTSFYPALLQVPEGSPREALLAVKEQLRRMTRKGIGFGLLKTYGEEQVRAQLAALPRADIAFNYLGQTDALTTSAAGMQGGLELAPEPGGSAFDARNESRYPLVCNAFIRERRLRLGWTHTGAYKAATIQAFSGEFMENLKAIVAHC